MLRTAGAARVWPQGPGGGEEVLPVKIRELYHHGVLTAHPDETVTTVAGRMQQEAVGSLAVVEEGRLVGIVTERDLVRAASDGADPLATRIRGYVTHGVAIAAPTRRGAGWCGAC